MDRLETMSVFVAVAEEEGFSAAARRLRMSPPAVTRAVAALETRLGIKLLERTTRYVRATEAGQRYLEDARRILAEVDSADQAAAGTNTAPRGHISLTAPSMFGRMYVMPGIVEYLLRYPNTEVSAVLLDRVVNLMEEGFDIAVRIGELPDSTMRAVRVGSVRLIVCATPTYLTQQPALRSPKDLLHHRIIASSASGAIHWRFESANGNRSLRLKPRLTVSSNEAAIEAAMHGFGVTRVLSYQVARHIGAGGLVAVLRRYEPPPWPIHIVHREGRFGSAKVRALVDLLAERLRADRALQ
jgi:DNA-binding transcriptional LysR family regulator